MRAGTENVPGIVGFAEALRIAVASSEAEAARLIPLRDEFARLIVERLPHAIMNGSMNKRLPNNLNVTIPGADHEFLAIALDARGVACSTKSACNELDAEISHVLQALRNAEEGESTVPPTGLRFSLGRSTTREDIVATVEILAEIVDTLIVSLRHSA
jgi:cysteine desulfurase